MSEEREAFYKWCAQPKIIDDVAEAAWFAALEWQAARQSAGATSQTAKQRYDELHVADEETDPVERLRAFCSLAMNGQDWVDVEPFFAALTDGAAGQKPIYQEQTQNGLWQDVPKDIYDARVAGSFHGGAVRIVYAAPIGDTRAQIEAKCIVGSTDPYPAGIERSNREVWNAAWQAARQSAGATGQHDGNPWLRVIMERDGWRNAMTGLCTIWPKTPDEAATHLRARLHPDRTAPISNNGAKPCTCHPDDNPPVPCAQKYAYSDCVVSQPTESEPTVLTDEELFALIKHVDPRAVRIPPGIRAIADALFARAQSESARVPPERVTAAHWKKLAEVNQALVEHWQRRAQSESKLGEPIGYLDEQGTPRLCVIGAKEREWIQMAGLKLLYAVRMPRYEAKGGDDA